MVQIINLSDASIRSGHNAQRVISKVTVQLLKATTDINELGCVDKRNSSLNYFPTAHMRGNPLLYSVNTQHVFTTVSFSGIYTQWWPHSLAQWMNMREKKYFGCVIYQHLGSFKYYLNNNYLSQLSRASGWQTVLHFFSKWQLTLISVCEVLCAGSRIKLSLTYKS